MFAGPVGRSGDISETEAAIDDPADGEDDESEDEAELDDIVAGAVDVDDMFVAQPWYRRRCDSNGEVQNGWIFGARLLDKVTCSEKM